MAPPAARAPRPLPPQVWDLRTPKRPNYTIKSERGFVMIAFSPNDLTLLGSAVDNEVTLFSSMDGRRLLGLDAARTGNRDNYTRSYFVRLIRPVTPNYGSKLRWSLAGRTPLSRHRRPYDRRSRSPAVLKRTRRSRASKAEPHRLNFAAGSAACLGHPSCSACASDPRPMMPPRRISFPWLAARTQLPFC